jgi:hypothetical protein
MPPEPRTARPAYLWWAVLGVAVCGVVATAHGLYEVALGCTVPAGISALYVPITDGLALVAYAATDRLRGAARVYAWTVVLVAAGLSGTAQAVMLGGLGEPPVQLRYGVGAWPAVAVAVAAHLLWLVGRPVAAAVAVPDQVDTPVGVSAEELDTAVSVQVSAQVGEGLDRLRVELLDKLRAPLDNLAVSKPVSKPKPAAVSNGRERSEDYREAVRRMLADGVARSTANHRADAAEKAGALPALLDQYPAVRPVEAARV